MNAEYLDVIFGSNGEEIIGKHKNVQLPFRRTSARAIIVRRKDGAILGTLHYKGGKYALPGGAIDDGESAEEALIRELEEENITLIGSDEAWRERISVDYYAGYQELTVWYVFIVDDAAVEPCQETVESKWITQDEDIWYPDMREKIFLALKCTAAEHLKYNIVVSKKI
jgi:8-oxo-dGTP pyrophosphatase MutT (NUDIX family)